MARSQARSAQRRREILAAALVCFTEHGIAGTTIEMIRDRSGASIGSLYHHFGNKDQIAATLYLQGLCDFSEVMLARLEASKDARGGIAAMIESYIDWIGTHPDWARYIFSTRSEVIKGQAEELLAQANREYFDRLRAWLRPQVAAGALRELPPELYRPLIIGPVQDYLRAWLAGRVREEPGRYAEIFVDAAWRAVAGMAVPRDLPSPDA